MTRHDLSASLWKQNPDDDTLRSIITSAAPQHVAADNSSEEKQEPLVGLTL